MPIIRQRKTLVHLLPHNMGLQRTKKKRKEHNLENSSDDLVSSDSSTTSDEISEIQFSINDFLYQYDPKVSEEGVQQIPVFDKPNKSQVARDQIHSPVGKSRTATVPPGARQQAPESHKLECSQMLALVIAVFAALLMVACCVFPAYHDKDVSVGLIGPPKLRSDHPLDAMAQLQPQFPNQGVDLWSAIAAGIKSLQRNNKPLVVMFIHTPDTATLAQCLAKQISRSIFPNAVSVDSAELSGPDYGSVIEQLASHMRAKGAVLLGRLEELPGYLAPALHVLCDRESPAVQGAMVAMTLRVFGTEEDLVSAPINLVLQQLERLWGGAVDEDKLPAVLTRITSLVLPVLNEYAMNYPCED